MRAFVTTLLAAAALQFVGETRAQAPPSVSFRLGAADAQAVPYQKHGGKTGGGNIDVRQPSPDTLVITMTGAAVAGCNPFACSRAGLTFDLTQDFAVVAEKPEVALVHLYLQGRVVGLLRTKCGGTSGTGEAGASVSCGGTPLASFALPARIVCKKENLSVFLRGEPVCVPVLPGCYTLRQSWAIHADHPAGGFPGLENSAEFAPAPALDPAWISYVEPFHGAAKRDFGFQVILKAVPACGNPPGTSPVPPSPQQAGE